MRILTIPLLALGMAWGLFAWSIEIAGPQVEGRLQPHVVRAEANATVTDFKVFLYEPNTGRARAYAVLAVYRQGRVSHQVGRLYEFRSNPAAEAWRVAGRRTLWDESRGDARPWIAPYWAMK